MWKINAAFPCFELGVRYQICQHWLAGWVAEWNSASETLPLFPRIEQREYVHLPPKNTTKIWRHGSGTVLKWFDITVYKLIQMPSVSRPVWLYVQRSWSCNDSEGFFMDFWLRSNTNKSPQNFNIRSHPKQLFSLSAESLRSSRNPCWHILHILQRYSMQATDECDCCISVEAENTTSFNPVGIGFMQCEST